MSKRENKPKKTTSLAEASRAVVDRSLLIRGQRVLLDDDLAKLYGVETKRLNEAVRRNRERFPDDFAFRLTAQEWEFLRSQIATSNASDRRGGRRYLPWAFTEQGVAMLSSVLRSPTAVAVNIEIMRAFVQLRQVLSTPGEFAEQVRQILAKVDRHDEDIRIIYRVLDQMLHEPPKPKRKIGFQRD
ncbi:MAG: ORF6N domain-containing protein [Planctomycetales bacterium]|nr:ORF6N domain-containing protein [Planctomycetales bacterium]